MVIESPQTSDPQLDWDDDEQFVTVRKPYIRHLRSLLSLAFVATLVLVGFFGIRSWFNHQLDPAGEPGAEVEIIVPIGATTSDIGRQLASAGVIPNSTFFRYYTEWTDKGNFQAGEYIFQENSSADEAIAVLEAGPKPPVFARFQIREGLWISEMLSENRVAAGRDNGS